MTHIKADHLLHSQDEKQKILRLNLRSLGIPPGAQKNLLRFLQDNCKNTKDEHLADGKLELKLRGEMRFDDWIVTILDLAADRLSQPDKKRKRITPQPA